MPVSSSFSRVAILNVVGLCRRLIGEDTPFLTCFAGETGPKTIRPVLPAVTSTMQATFLTGKKPGDHGIVGNYWYDREFAEHRGWKQSNHLVAGRKLWEVIRETHPDYTCAKVFWWNNLYSSADYSATPRPIYCADGKKVFDIQTWPMALREEMKRDLGDFPFPSFWGPAAGLPSSRWIADSAMWFERKFAPSLNLVYLPHLDYNLQRLGPDVPAVAEDLRLIDRIVEDLVTFFRERDVLPIVVSEYGITPANRPIHINRAFRRRGWIVCRDELGREQIDLGSCRAFAIVDHQLAHIYVNDPSILSEVKETVESLPGVARVYAGEERAGIGLDHPRSGDLIALSEEDAWFTYYYWEDDDRAPDFARTVDIHRKPGYDPVELFLDPALPFPRWKIAGTLIRKKLGFRTLMDVIPLDAGLVRGSHGTLPASEEDYPVLIGDMPATPESPIPADKVFELFYRTILAP